MDSAQQIFFNGICCTGAPTCAAVVTGSSYVQAGTSVIISWVATGAVSFNVWIDGVFQANTTNTFFTVNTPAIGSHTYNIIPLCANGATGTPRSGAWVYADTSTCAGVVLTATTSRDGVDVLINFTLSALAGITANVFVDGVFYANAAAVVRVLNLADCNLHSFMVVAKCSNGVSGGTFSGTFQYCVPCAAVVTQSTATRQGDDVLLSWTATGAVSFDVFKDGAFILNTAAFSYLVVGGVDGLHHTYTILPKCLNGPGTGKDGEWEFQPDPPVCTAFVTTHTATRQGNDVLLAWTATGAVSFKIYVDNVFKIQTTNLSYLIADAADGYMHTYRIEPICGPGGIGTVGSGNFSFSAITEQTGNIQVMHCVATGRILSVSFRYQPVTVLSGHQFALFSGRVNTSSAPVGVGVLSVQCDEDAGSLRVTDSNGVVECRDYAGADTYEFPNFAITAAGTFSIVLDCNPCS
ncbi:MAG: hypothetical protein V4722_04280 [Bacteroidota bacterium]